MLTKTTYNYAKAVTKSDSVNIVMPPGRDTTDAIYVGTPSTTGTAAVVLNDDSVVSLVGIPAGTIIPIAIKRLNSTTTDVSNVVALWQV